MQTSKELIAKKLDFLNEHIKKIENMNFSGEDLNDLRQFGAQVLKYLERTNN